MAALDELVERDALLRLKAEYFLYLDTKQWDRWLSLFLPDAELCWDRAVSVDGRDPRTLTFTGVEQIRANVVDRVLAKATTVHHGHAPVIEIHSDIEASGIWAMEDIVIGSRGTTQGYGHYYETYRKVGERWHLATLHLTRLLLRQVVL